MVQVKVNLSQNQKAKIKRDLEKEGDVKIRISAENMTGPVVLHIHQADFERFNEFKKNGKGIQVKVHKTDQKREVENGGWLGGVVKNVTGQASKAAKLVAARTRAEAIKRGKEAAKRARQQATKRGSNIIKKRTNLGVSEIDSLKNSAISRGANEIDKYASQRGFGAPYPRYQRGGALGHPGRTRKFRD